MQNKTPRHPHHPGFPLRMLSLVFLLALPAILIGCRRSKPDIEKVGGTTMIVKIDPVPAKPKETAEIILKLKERFAKARFPGAYFTDIGGGKIQVDLPEITGESAKKARKIIEQSGRLELMPVNLKGFERQADGRTLAEQVLAGDVVIPGWKALAHEYTDSDGKRVTEVLLVSAIAALDNGDISIAAVNGFDPTKVDVTLTGDGEDKMIALTKNMTPGRDRIAIVVDGKLKSAPVVQSVPLGRAFVIEGNTAEEAKTLASTLVSPMKRRLRVAEERTVDPAITPEGRKKAGEKSGGK